MGRSWASPALRRHPVTSIEGLILVRVPTPRHLAPLALVAVGGALLTVAPAAATAEAATNSSTWRQIAGNHFDHKRTWKRPVASPTSPTSTSTTSTASIASVVQVSTSTQLASALAAAVPGTTIRLADGRYTGRFKVTRSGTATAPIRLTGTRNAVLDGGGISGGYVLHLDRASYWQVDGITVTNAAKGIVLDQSSHVVLTNLAVHHSGAELVLMRNYSSDNTISSCQIFDSGLVTPGYGEGVYIGLAVSNWSSTSQSRTGGGPDRSDRNRIVGNHIYATTAENVDIKEGTTGGLISGNRFDATGMTGANYADSWVDIAGNEYVVRDNVGVNPGSSLLDGYQTHVQVTGWAERNVFEGNASAVNAGGYGINIHTRGVGNVVTSTNTVTGAARGLTNITVTP
jgi:hypothetical protein